MNNRSVLRALAIATLAFAGVAAIAVGAYNAGMAQGLAGGRAVAEGPGGTPLVYAWPRPWGFGFVPIFPLFFFFIFLFVAGRGLMWHGAWRGRRDWNDGIPPAFEEWHRRAHREQPASTPAAGSQT